MSSNSVGDYEKENGVCLIDYDSRYVTHNTSEYITTVANGDT